MSSSDRPARSRTRVRSAGVLLLAACAGVAACDDAGDDPADATVGEASAFARERGFSFPNYGNVDVTNLTTAEMVRLFGDAVCAQGSGETCSLSTTAARWMKYTNARMGGGHCFGMAAASLRFWAGTLDLAALGGMVSRTFDLELANNEALQRELAFHMALQAVPQVAAQDFGSWGTKATPREVVAHLEAGLAAGELFLVGFDRRGGGGHAITVQSVRDGATPGTKEIVCYDNNFPGRETVLTVDVSADTWRYDFAATRPDVPQDVWEGDAQTFSLSVMPVAAFAIADAGPLPCPPAICGDFNPQAAPERTMTTVGRNASVLVTDAQGRRTGVANGVRLDEIPGARTQTLRGGLWDDAEPPLIDLPGDEAYTVTLSSPDDATPAEIWWEGPGFIIGVADIFLGPEVEDSVYFEPDKAYLRYETTETETALVVMNAITDTSDWLFEIGSQGEEGGQVLYAELDLPARVLVMGIDDFEESSREGSFDLSFLREGEDGEEIDFLSEDIPFPYGAELAIYFGEWDDGGDELVVEVDLDGDGYDEAQGDYTINLLDEDP